MVQELREHGDHVSSMCTTPDGKYVITGSLDRTARVWSLEDRMTIQELTGRPSGDLGVRLQTASTVTGSDDMKNRIWSLKDGTMVQELKGHSGEVKSVCTMLDGKHVITGSHDNTARVWSLDDGTTFKSSMEAAFASTRCARPRMASM